MRAVHLLLVAAALAACTGAPATTLTSSPAASATGVGVGPSADLDRACAQMTLRSVIDAVNTGDAAMLAQLIGTSIWGSLTYSGTTYTRPEEAINVLVERSRAGERWSLTRLDFNGRGWDGAVHFGLVVRRAGPGLPQPYVEHAGKGALDCPRGRVLILGIGDPLAPRARERLR